MCPFVPSTRRAHTYKFYATCFSITKSLLCCSCYTAKSNLVIDLEVLGSQSTHILNEQLRGHLHLPMEKSFLDITCRICNWHKASKLNSLPKVLITRHPGVTLLHFLCADFPWPNLLDRQRGKGSGWGYCNI